MDRTRLGQGIALAASSTLLLVGCTTVGAGTGGGTDEGAGTDAYTMVTVVKAQTIPWFQRMAVGVQEFADESGIDARQEGADDVSPEKQVAIIYAATKGYIDAVPVEDVRRYEDDLMRFLETRHPGVLSTIAEKKTIDDELKGALEGALKDFSQQFMAGRQPAAVA